MKRKNRQQNSNYQMWTKKFALKNRKSLNTDLSLHFQKHLEKSHAFELLDFGSLQLQCDYNHYSNLTSHWQKSEQILKDSTPIQLKFLEL